jgi:hypothetical protein
VTAQRDGIDRIAQAGATMICAKSNTMLQILFAPTTYRGISGEQCDDDGSGADVGVRGFS